MKIELKNLKINLAFSEETTMFKADLYIDGVNVGDATNDGHGGCTFYRADGKPSSKELVHEAEAYCKALPPYTWKSGDKTYTTPMNLEMFIDDLVEKVCREKEAAKFAKKLQSSMLKGLVYGTPEKYSLLTWKGHTVASLLTTPHGRAVLASRILDVTKEGHKILNTNLPEQLNKIGK